MSQIQQQIQNIPGYDYAMDKWNDYAGEHFNKRDPYQDEEGHTLKLRNPHSTADEKKMWNRVRRRAWVHDRCFLGSCGVGLDCGLGLAPLVVALFPALGPLFMYLVHSRLIHMVTEKYHIPNKLKLKMESEIVADLLISLPPIIGGYFAWMNGCSTRNAGYIYEYFESVAESRGNDVEVYEGTGELSAPPEPVYRGDNSQQNSSRAYDTHYGNTNKSTYDSSQPSNTRYQNNSKANKMSKGNHFVSNDQSMGYV